MTVESILAGWTGPSSPTEQEKQERTERMVREAIRAHGAFDGYSINVFAKGSYPNNTNVRSDSDVDIAVECCECIYWEEEAPGVHGPASPYQGPWTPSKLRAEVEEALRSRFAGEVDPSGSTAVKVRSSTARVDADVVPCFTYEYHLRNGTVRRGTRILKKDGSRIENYPSQHLERGRSRNLATNRKFKEAVRVLKRIENAMVDEERHRSVASFLVESLVYNCSNSTFGRYTWEDRVRGLLFEIYDGSQGGEPEQGRWVEVNECKYLFDLHQAWSRQDANEFAAAAWAYLGFA